MIMDKFINECYLQKTNQFDALDVWNKINKIGVKIALSLDNKGENVIARLNSDNSKIIGVISDEDSKTLKPFFEAGWNEYDKDTKKINNPLFVGSISKVDDKADENKRIGICVFVKVCK